MLLSLTTGEPYPWRGANFFLFWKRNGRCSFWLGFLEHIFRGKFYFSDKIIANISFRKHPILSDSFMKTALWMAFILQYSKKCDCFSFSRIWLIKQISYFITILVKMAQKKVLGITIDNKLDFSTYPSYIIKNFNKAQWPY